MDNWGGGTKKKIRNWSEGKVQRPAHSKTDMCKQCTAVYPCWL